MSVDTEVGATVQGVGQGGRRWPDLGENLRGGGPGCSVIWVGNVGDDTAHWEAFGRIPPQGVPRDDET